MPTCCVWLCGSLLAYTEQYVEYDPFLTPPDPSNPWITDDATVWELEARFAHEDEIGLDSLIGLRVRVCVRACMCFILRLVVAQCLFLALTFCRLFVWQQGARPAESQEVGFWHRRGLKRPRGERAVPQVPGVRVQLRESQVQNNARTRMALYYCSINFILLVQYRKSFSLYLEVKL